jgi:hypothetical protein
MPLLSERGRLKGAHAPQLPIKAVSTAGHDRTTTTLSRDSGYGLDHNMYMPASSMSDEAQNWADTEAMPAMLCAPSSSEEGGHVGR